MIMPVNVNAFVTHWKPHLSDLGAIALFRLSGDDVCPGASSAPIFFWKGGTQEGLENFIRSIAKLRDCPFREIIPIGVGGGEFDEHAVGGSAAKEGKSEMLLVAEKLGYDQDSALQVLLRYVTEEDQSGYNGNGAGDQDGDLRRIIRVAGLANAIKLRYNSDSNICDHHDEVVNDLLQHFVMPPILKAYEAHYVPADVECSVERENVVDAKGKEQVIAAAVTDYPGIVSFLLSAHGGRSSIVIVDNPHDGCIRIVAARRAFKQLEDAVRIVRAWEQQAAGSKRGVRFEKLAAEGTLPEIPQWHYQRGAQSLFHGTNTHPDVPRQYPTKLSLCQLREAARIALSGAFEPGRAEKCCRGICSATPGSPCPWYVFGLARCRKVRYEEMRAAKDALRDS